MDIVFLVAYASFFSPLVTLAVSLWIKNMTFELRVIRLLMAVAFLVDLASLLMGLNGINTYPLGNLFFLFQSVSLMLIFGEVLRIKRQASYIALAYVAIFFANYFFLQGPYILNSYSHSLSAVILILFALLYLRHLLVELPVVFVYEMPAVWITLSVLIYYSGNLFLFILNNYFTNGIDGNQRLMWMIHNILNIMKNFLFLISIWQSLRKTSSSSS